MHPQLFFFLIKSKLRNINQPFSLNQQRHNTSYSVRVNIMANKHICDNAPTLSKKRKLGKNKKKSWRVSKVEDIEEFLDDERQQMRTGGLVSEKPDESLFVLDKSSSNVLTKPTGQAAQSQNKRHKKDKPLRCLALLQPDPHSKVVRKPDQDNFQNGKRTSRVLERLRAKSQSQSRLKAAEESLKYTAARKTATELNKQLPVKPLDLWAEDEDNAKGKAVKPPKNYKRKPSALQATVIPHPGASVNPSYEDHQALLLEAHLTEVKKAKELKKIHNALDAKFPDKHDAPNESTYLTEMSAGLVSDSDDDEDISEDISLSVNPPVRREDRKTKKQKRIELETKKQAKEKERMTDVKQRENKILRIPSIKTEINQAERKQKARAELKRKQKEQEPYKTKRLNNIKFEEQDLDLKLSTELVGSYREIKPEGHLLKDIYKSVQRRNIIEPRVKQKAKRKYKRKTFEKKGHKAVTL